MTVTLIKFAHQQELFSWAADNFIACALQTLAQKPWFDVALSGGSTAQGLFKELSSRAHDFPLLGQIRFFVSDERAVDLSSENSNAGNAWRQLLKPLGIGIQNFFPLYDATCDPKLSAKNYEKLLKDLLVLGPDMVPVFDLLYLGIGQDGHTASIFPDSPLVKNIGSDPRLVAASGEEIAGFRRITFMPRLINAAKSICVMAVGEAKTQVIADIIDGPLMPQKLPAQLIVRSGHEHLTFLVA